MGRVFSINIGTEKGEPKSMITAGFLKEDHGFVGDCHAGPGTRQVSLLAIEEIEKVEAGHPEVDFQPGIFAENITTEGLDLSKIKVGDRLSIGSDVTLKVTQIGKECRKGCSISRVVGDCIMPRQGIFAAVEKGGPVKIYDSLFLERQR